MIVLYILFKIIRGESFGCDIVYSLDISHIEGDERAVVYNTDIGALQTPHLSSLMSLAKTEKVLGIDLDGSSVIKAKPIELYLRQREAADKAYGVVSHYAFKSGRIVLESCILGSSKLYRVLEGTVVIEAKAFSKNTSTQFAIKLPKSCTMIKLSCFRDTNITSINLENVRAVMARAFSGCKYLKSVTLDNCSLYVDAFSGSGLESVVLRNIREISQNCFLDCAYLTNVELGRVNKIKSSAFQGCKRLKEIYLPIKDTMLENAVFAECSSLEIINIDNISTNIGMNVFTYCLHLNKDVYSALKQHIPEYMFFHTIYL